MSVESERSEESRRDAPGVVALTGGSGFIGRALVDRLIANGWGVRLLSRRARTADRRAGLERVVGDLCADAPLDPAWADGADAILHLAGELHDETIMERLHVGGTARVLAAARAARVPRIVQLSSVGVYGLRATGRVNEETPWAPIGTYETTKAAADALAIAAADAGDVQVLFVRPSIVYGPGMKSDFITSMASLIKAGRFVHFGPPGAIMPVVPREDVVDLLIRALVCTSASPWRAWNLSRDLTMEDWAALLADAVGYPLPIPRLPQPPEAALSLVGSRWPGFPLTPERLFALTRRTRYPAVRAERELRWRPARTHGEALAALFTEVR